MLVNSFGTFGNGDPYFASVSCLLHCEGANNGTTFTDVKGHTFTSNSGAKTSTTQILCGTSSGFCDGVNDSVSSPNAAGWEFGTGDWTIEGLFYFVSVAVAVIVDLRPTGTDGFYPTLYFGASGSLRFYTNGGVASPDKITDASTLLVNTLYHIALSKNSNVTRLFVNGVQGGSNYADTNNYISGSALRLGIGAFSTGPCNMYFDEFRITKGVGRYPSGFTVPTTPFSDS